MAENEGDLGADRAPSLPDTRMQERAIRERWPMSPDVRIKVLKRLCKIVDEDAVHEIGRPGHREVISAARALISADKLNLEQARFDHATRPPEMPADDFVIDLSADEPEGDPAQPGDPAPA